MGRGKGEEEGGSSRVSEGFKMVLGRYGLKFFGGGGGGGIWGNMGTTRRRK